MDGYSPDAFFAPATRQPPFNLMAERSLLGALMANNKAYARVGDFLKAEHFYDPLHGRIYGEIEHKIMAGQVADVITMRPSFENEIVEVQKQNDEGKIETKTVLGPYYLAQLLSNMVGVLNAGEYGKVIYDCWMRRQIIDSAEVLANKSFIVGGEEPDAAEIAADGASMLLELAQGSQARTVVKLSTAIDDVLHSAERASMGEKRKAIPSGLPALDTLIGGFEPQQLIIVAGRPGMGKSVAATVLALAAARYRREMIDEKEPQPAEAVALFSMEMAADEFGERALANQAGVSGTKIRNGDMIQKEWDRLAEARNVLLDLPLVIDDRPALTLAQVRLRARSIAARQKLGMVIVDHLGLMKTPPEIARQGITAQTEYITQGLKALSKELQVPVIALCQLSREVEKREDKRPMLADLRWSGSIEQDADVVIFLYRDEYYLERSQPQMKPDESQSDFDVRHQTWKTNLERVRKKLELAIAKQRRGPTGVVHLRFDGATSRIWQEGDGNE